MSSVDITVGRRWQDDVRHIHSLRDRRPADSTLNLLELRDIVDIVVDGTNLTAPVSEEAIFGLMETMLSSLVELVENRSRKAIIEFHHQPWELVLVPDGASLQLSLYSIDRHRRVIARDLPIQARPFIDALCETAGEMLTGLFRISEHFSSNGRIRRISQAIAHLKRNRRFQFPPQNEPEDAPDAGMHVASTSSSGGLTLGYRFDAGDEALLSYRGEHVFDLHALLVDGVVHAEFGSDKLVLSDQYPFLSIASLLDRTRQLFNQLESNANAPFVLDEQLAHLDFCIEGQGSRWLLRGRDAQHQQRHEWTAHPAECLDTLVSVAEMFVCDLAGANPTLEVNERFLQLRREVEKLRLWHRDLCCNNVYHDRPEDYLRRLGHLEPLEAQPPEPPQLPWPLSSVHTLFPQRIWTLRAGRIDFSSLTLVDRSLLVSTSDGLKCLDVDDGTVTWAAPDASEMVITGDSVVAHNGEHQLNLRDLRDGHQQTAIELNDDWKGLRGAAKYGDELAVAAARNSYLMGFDATDGTARWTHSMGPGRLENIVFDGPLVCAQTSEGVVTALNPKNGDILWKIRMGGRPESAVRMHQGRLYTVTHDPLHPSSTLHALYPFTGRTVWQLRLNGFCSGPPTFIDQWMLLPVERHGQIKLIGVDLEAVDPRINWQLDLSSAGMDHPTPVLAVDIDGGQHGLIRTDRAELTCFTIADGEVRWRSMPAAETLLLQGNLPLFRLGEAVVNVSETVDLRELSTGRLMHSFSAIEAPEFGFLAAPFRLLFGEQAPVGEAADRLTAFSVDHFLAVV